MHHSLVCFCLLFSSPILFLPMNFLNSHICCQTFPQILLFFKNMALSALGSLVQTCTEIAEELTGCSHWGPRESCPLPPPNFNFGSKQIPTISHSNIRDVVQKLHGPEISQFHNFRFF